MKKIHLQHFVTDSGVDYLIGEGSLECGDTLKVKCLSPTGDLSKVTGFQIFIGEDTLPKVNFAVQNVVITKGAIDLLNIAWDIYRADKSYEPVKFFWE